MSARGDDGTQDLRVLRSPHHNDRRSQAALEAIDSVEALQEACVTNHQSLIQLHDGRYLLARRADIVDGTLGVWVSASGADDQDNEETLVEEVFQPLPFTGGRAESPRLIILGLLQGKFRHTHTGRDYWITDIEANDYGVRAVTLATSPSGALSRGRAVRRTVDEFISAFLAGEPAPARSPPAARTAPAAGGATTPARLTLASASLDVSRRPIGKALRLWPHWQLTAPSLADPGILSSSQPPCLVAWSTLDEFRQSPCFAFARMTNTGDAARDGAPRLKPPVRAAPREKHLPIEPQITWLPKACRTPEVRKEVAEAVIKAMTSVKSAEISPENLVVRFGEAVDGFPLPKGFSANPELQAPQK
ncbi:hypothetical protein AB1Y20_011117 [Prymnesium parvum]|uniref:Uncharacterized protein n=1 Tax=Prymnesium parvum TaxID=97485 RepID=A0AB34IPH3_PRYPA